MSHSMTHAIDITANIAKYQGFFLYTQRADILSQDPVKSQSRKTGCYNDRIVLQFDISAAVLFIAIGKV